MAPETRPRARGRGRAAPANPMPGTGRNKGVDPGYDGPARYALDKGGAAAAGARGKRGNPAGPGGGKSDLGEAALVGPGGRQLQAKVQAGSITAEQAGRTLRQRQTLAKALGPNWRDKLTVGGESFAQVNKQLKANPGNAKLAAIRKKLTAKRTSLLAAARDKNGGEGGKKKEGQE